MNSVSEHDHGPESLPLGVDVDAADLESGAGIRGITELDGRHFEARRGVLPHGFETYRNGGDGPGGFFGGTGHGYRRSVAAAEPGPRQGGAVGAQLALIFGPDGGDGNFHGAALKRDGIRGDLHGAVIEAVEDSGQTAVVRAGNFVNNAALHLAILQFALPRAGDLLGKNRALGQYGEGEDM